MAMRFGCCGSMICPTTDPIGIDSVEAMARVGFDYAELSLRDIVALPAAKFAELVRRVEESGIACEACNNFFPPEVRLTGVDVRVEGAVEYAAAAMDRAAGLGAAVIVFGSAGSRNVADGFPADAAWGQLVEVLRRLGPPAAERGITIAIEHLNRGESNIVNRVSNAIRLAREVGHPGVQVLVDWYHLALEDDDPGAILDAGPLVRHVHLAKVAGRRFPTREEDEFGGLFENLRRIGYSGRCSIEAYTNDFPGDAGRALRAMREALKRSGSAPHA